jgi:hypothetical protein
MERVGVLVVEKRAEGFRRRPLDQIIARRGSARRCARRELVDAR